MSPQGEARFDYKPGQPRPQMPAIEEEDYTIFLHNMGKPGWMGWKVKAGKFPVRQMTFTIQGSEDPIRGGERQFPLWLSLQPQAVMLLYDIAESAGYTGDISFDLPDHPGSPKCKEAIGHIDKVLQWIQENGASMRAHLKAEEYRGRPQVRVDYWIPANSAQMAESAVENVAENVAENVKSDNESESDGRYPETDYPDIENEAGYPPEVTQETQNRLMAPLVSPRQRPPPAKRAPSPPAKRRR